MSERNLHVLRELVAEAWQRVNKMYEQVDEAMRKTQEAVENEIQAHNEQMKYRKQLFENGIKLMKIKEDARFQNNEELQALARRLDSEILQDMEKSRYASAMYDETVKARERAQMRQRKAMKALAHARRMYRDHETILFRQESILRAMRSVLPLEPLMYDPDPLSADEIAASHLLNPMPQVMMSHKNVLSAGLSESDLAEHPFLRVANPWHSIDTLVSGILQNKTSAALEKDAHNGRNDLIFSLIRKVGDGMKQDRIEPPGPNKANVFLYYELCCAIVLAKETSADEDLASAIDALRGTFREDMYHYDRRLQWIIGIAIAGNKIFFGQIHRNTNDMTELASFNLGSMQDRFGCVQAAINIGRWCRWVCYSNFLRSLHVRLRTPFCCGCADFYFNPPVVTKLLYSGRWTEYNIEFYTHVACVDASGSRGAIPYCEWATCVKRVEDDLLLRLQPFGVVREPRLTEIQSTLRCVLTALSALHARGWVHLDVRFSNIVWCEDDNWVLIDAEYARPIGAAMPARASSRQDPRVTSADAAADLHCVGKMLEDTIYAELPHAQAFIAALIGNDAETPREMRTAPWALEHAFFREPYVSD